MVPPIRSQESKQPWRGGTCHHVFLQRGDVAVRGREERDGIQSSWSVEGSFRGRRSKSKVRSSMEDERLKFKKPFLL